MTVTSVFASIWAHKAELLLAFAALIAGASVFIKALEGVVGVLVTIFPGLKGADDKLKGVAAWLDAAAKSGFLNTVALSPRALKAFVLPLLAMAFLVTAAPAHAQVLVSSGPTLPLMEVRPGNAHPVSLAAGAGYQLNFTLPALQVAIGGKAWDLLNLQAMAFGSAVSSTSGATFGALSAAVGLCTLSSLLCLGGGHDLITAGGLKSDWFAVFALSINFGTAPSSPPAGVEKGPAGLPRANTVYFGGP